ncbi:MAG: iron-sulfur cluster repair di-iron protein [Terriglobales bacterium]
MLDTAKTVREIAVEMPQATRVFEKLGIDYCCGGLKSLDEACAAANLRVGEVLQSLEAADKAAPEQDWKSGELGELIAHIVRKHHAYVKSEVPRLEALIAKVCGVHGKNHPELLEVQNVFRALGGELSMHLMKEENILFPYVVRMEEAVRLGQPSIRPPFGSVENPIHMMLMEHDSAGDALRELRRLTNDYAAPADACISYQTLYRALLEFEADLHQHIHLENNILFPRAIAMEGGK